MLFPLAWVLVPASLAAQTLSHDNPTIYQNDADLDTHRILQRNAAIQEQLSQAPAQGMKKMTDDEGEKFLLDYWFFESNSTDRPDTKEPKTTETAFHPRSYPDEPSAPLDNSTALDGWMGPISPLLRRDFQCPSGTYSCTSINRPDSCCSTGSSCELVQDTGSGDVGCCPSGQQCSGTIGSCKPGYTSCSASLGGGCCIPGYQCVTGGCAKVYTVTITVGSTVLVSTVTSTVPATSTASRSSTVNTWAPTTGEFTPPARPTSLTTATTSQTTGAFCPIGFYACSAVYHGGCCRTGRDCDTTSCPQTPSTTITTNDRTIVVPAPTPTIGRCASGWFSCADTVGGGCCPTGYACGSSCTAVTTATTTGTVAKGQPTYSAADKRMPARLKILGMSVVGLLWTM
ncbi:hypothetical protein BDV25DRAFT_149245 [Aspergillus avenaceus]|uniref:GPI anchored protein n=1 Tax=Aspergillus avenaceus TaxID=36643 RepID=A0A5N6U4Z6_ASPAV|nr:hypothetical protein BDV25DRAFT_149245 [Aspergillus avenaceus]